MSVLNPFQYKQCLFILTLPKCNSKTYRPEKSEMVKTIQMEISIISNKKRSQIKINVYVMRGLRGMFYDSKTQLMQFTHRQSD